MNSVISTLLIIAGLVVFLTGGGVMLMRLIRSRRNRAEMGNSEMTLSFSSDTPVIEMEDSFPVETQEKEEVKEIQNIVEPEAEAVLEDEVSENTAEAIDFEIEDEPVESQEEQVSEDAAEVEAEVELDEESREALIAAFFEEEPKSEEISDQNEETEEAADETVIEAEFDAAEEKAVEVEENLPAYAARASVPDAIPPLFKVAPPSVPDSDHPVVQRAPEEPTRIESEFDAKDETPENLELQVDEANYSFDEVPADLEEVEEEEVLSEEVSNQIEQIDDDLNVLADLISDIEQSLAEFSPLDADDFDAENTEVAA